MKIVYLSLGSNLGDRAEQIEQAVTALEAAGVAVRRRSPLYESEPVEMPAARWFFNCVLEVETELMPLKLLHLLQRIERRFGRRPAFGRQPAPRRLDIDLLAYGGHVIRTPELVVPHPCLARRRFVLEPLRELAPEWHHPVTRQTPAQMLAALHDRATVRRVRNPR